MKSKIFTYFIFIKFISLTLTPLSYADTNSEKSLTSYQILKSQTINKLKKVTLHSDPRLIVVGDFNNDGIHEYLGLSKSKKYTNYVFGSIRVTKKNDLNYWNNGVELSKDPSWSSNFETKTLDKNFSINGIWDVSIESYKGCVHPAQIVPSHLNKDDFMDFVIICHGYDAKPFPGEHSYVMLSTGLNKYKIDKLTNKIGFYHDGATADFNNDGILDILLTETNAEKLRVFINDGNGKFSLKNSYFSQFDSWRAFSTEILDVNKDGFFDIFIAGHEDEKYGALPTTILLGNKNNKFSKSNKITIPSVKGFGVVLDIIKHNNFLFIVRTGSKPNFYKGTLIQQLEINNISKYSVIKNKKMRWLDRIFYLKSSNSLPKFGSLTEINKGIDFIFDGKDMKPIE